MDIYTKNKSIKIKYIILNYVKMNKNWLIFLVATSALTIAGTAAYFSVTGLSILFAGASVSVMIMAGSLEFAKLVTATYLKQNWKNIKGLSKWYLTISVIILMTITSAGIFGYLSNAFQQQNLKLEQVQREISVWDTKIKSSNDQIASLNIQLNNLQQNQGKLLDNKLNNRLISSIDNRDKQSSKISNKISSLQDSIVSYNSQINDIKNKNIDIEKEVGGFRFVAESFNAPLQSVVKFFIILIVVVFDPLAIALVIAFNELTLNKQDKKEPEKTIENEEPEEVKEEKEELEPASEVKEEKSEYEIIEPEEIKVIHDLDVDEIIKEDIEEELNLNGVKHYPPILPLFDESKSNEIESIKNDYEAKIREIELNYELKSKEMESKIREMEKIKTISSEDLKSEHESKMQDLEKLISEYNSNFEELESNKAEYNLKLRELETNKAIYESKLEEFELFKSNYDSKFKELEIRKEEYDTKIKDAENLKSNYEIKLKDIEEKEESYKAKIIEMDRVNQRKIKKVEDEFLSKIEQLQDFYKEKLSDMENPALDKELLKNIKEMLVNTHGSLPYYHNKMDVLKRKIEEIIEHMEKL